MRKRPLEGCHVLIVEDEYLVAADLAAALEECGAVVFAPVGSVKDALDQIAHHGESLDAAVLDINLRGETVYPVAAKLYALNVPFVFTTGYDADGIPSLYSEVPRLEKPADIGKLVRILENTRRHVA
jgi:CheY-like chemotaxis protein